MIMVGECFLGCWMLFLYGWKVVTARLAIGLVFIPEEYIVDYSLIINNIIFYKNNKIIKID